MEDACTCSNLVSKVADKPGISLGHLTNVAGTDYILHLRLR